MKLRFTASESRTIAIGLVFVFLLALYGVLVNPMVSLYQANHETIDDLQHRLSVYQRVASRRAALEEELKQLSLSQPANIYYLKNKTQALAAAELQAYVKQIIEQAQGRLISTQPLAASDAEGFREVKIRVRMRGNIDVVQKVLYELESGTPLLILNDVSFVQARRARRRARSRAGVIQVENPLEVYFDLSGLMRATAS